MTGTIKYILRQLRKVSNGNLTVHLSAKHKDEFGLLCDGVNDTVEHMKSLILDVNDVSQQVGEAAIHFPSSSLSQHSVMRMMHYRKSPTGSCVLLGNA